VNRVTTPGLTSKPGHPPQVESVDNPRLQANTGLSQQHTVKPGLRDNSGHPATNDPADYPRLQANTDLTHKIEIIAHRGSAHDAHQNTLDAFAAAIELGADRIETDVRRTRDGVVVLHHDPGPPGVTLSDVDSSELPALSDRIGYSIPTLADTLAQFGDKILWDIELKEAEYENQVVGELSEFLTPDQFVLTSFEDSIVRTIRMQHPNLEVGLILGDEDPRNWLITRLRELYPMGRAARTGSSVLVANYGFLRFGFMRNVRNFRGKLWLWTVNGDANLHRVFRTPGVHGIVTDEVRRAVEIRDSLKS
jgi:glycerophosphoryl diester phosphodiesterase